MTQIQKLHQIEYTNYYSVFSKNGNKICDTATLEDALLMCSFDTTRTYKQVKLIMDEVVNVFSEKLDDDKQLNDDSDSKITAEPFLVK